MFLPYIKHKLYQYFGSKRKSTCDKPYNISFLFDLILSKKEILNLCQGYV